MKQHTPAKEHAPAVLPAHALSLDPLQIQFLNSQNASAMRKETGFDAYLKLEWEAEAYVFGAVYKQLATPKLFAAALDEVQRFSIKNGVKPLLVVPYLSEAHLKELQARRISGIDLCGNGIVTVPGKLFVARNGAPNRFTTSVPIKNIYRRNSALVGRVFLLHPAFENVSAIYKEISRRGGTVSKGTVSRVLKVLEEDLIVNRSETGIRLLQPNKLLDALNANFDRPAVSRTFTGKLLLPPDEALPALANAASENQIRLVSSGESAVGRYAVMATSETLSVYCTSIERLLACLPTKSDLFFPTLKLMETEEESVYFDTRVQEGFPWASPLQVYLELMSGEKRERETAAQVRGFLLDAAEKIMERNRA